MTTPADASARTQRTVITTARRARSVALLAILAVAVTVSAMDVLHSRTRAWVDESRMVNRMTREVIALAATRESSVRGYLLTGDTIFLAPDAAARGPLAAKTDSLVHLVAYNPAQQRRARQIEEALATWSAEFADQAIAARRQGRLDSALRDRTRSAQVLFDSARTTVATFLNDEIRIYASRRRSERTIQWVATAAVLLELAVLAGLLAILGRGLVRQAVAVALQQARLEEQAVELKQRTADAESLASDVQRANRAKSEFLATMSHELRTPLNAIIGYADLLTSGVRGPLPANQAEDVHRIRRAGAHLLALINDVLNFAKLEAARVDFANESVIVESVLVEAQSMVEPQARAKGLYFDRGVCASALTVRGDREKILQILLNLLSNAVKFTDGGGRVTLGCDDQDDTVRISVSDTGRGIAEDQLADVFEPFVQVGRRLSATDSGAGLGLAISRELARGMAGDLVAESAYGKGSTFTIVLPREVPEGGVRPRTTPTSIAALV